MVLEKDVDILITKTDELKIEVSTLMNNYDDLYVDIKNQQIQIDYIEGLIQPGSDKFKDLDARLTKLELDAKNIKVDINALQVE